MRTQNADRADIRISNLKRLAYLSSSVSAQIRAVFLMLRITGCRSRRPPLRQSGCHRRRGGFSACAERICGGVLCYRIPVAPSARVNQFSFSLNFCFDAVTAAFDNFALPSRTIEPSSLAALSVAALRRPAFSTGTVQWQYSFAIMPTRRVKKALAAPVRMELVSRCIPGIAAIVEPNTVPIKTSRSTSSMPAATKAVEATFA
jgi:hypothetical protein